MDALTAILLAWALAATVLLVVTLLGAAEVVEDNKHLQDALRQVAALPRDHNGTGTPIHDRLAEQRLRRELDRWDRQAGR